ncbi:hypothetical protein AnigIFM50267_001886 [Aspergillus niger]|nr:hypothetical protein AnigIFM50267_001886 [Aspergillus niger]
MVLHAPGRIVTANLALPADLAEVPHPEPAVSITREEIRPVSLLDGKAAKWLVYTHQWVPMSNNESYQRMDINPGPQSPPHWGVDIQFNDLGPGGRVPLHWTTSTGYLVVLQGTVHLICPAQAYNPTQGPGKMIEVACDPGDVVRQRGTLHALENRGMETVGFMGIGIRAEPLLVGIEGQEQEAKRTIVDAWHNN